MGIINCKELADSIVEHISQHNCKRKPCLAVIQVGQDQASTSYIKQKQKTSIKAGFSFQHIILKEQTSESALIKQIHELNQNTKIDGLIVQLPLPKHIDPYKVAKTIMPQKDVDGFSPEHLGKLMYNDQNMAPCTPLGIIKILESTKVELAGLHAVVVGASTIVGKPIVPMLSNKNMTVTLCHKHTKQLDKIVSMADVLISATGNIKAIDAKNIKPGAIVIDVGINLVNNKITGDLDAETVKSLASFYTTVPGGVGPMTVAMLMLNTWHAYLIKQNAN